MDYFVGRTIKIFNFKFNLKVITRPLDNHMIPNQLNYSNKNLLFIFKDLNRFFLSNPFKNLKYKTYPINSIIFITHRLTQNLFIEGKKFNVKLKGSVLKINFKNFLYDIE